jgi:hypothetical protein
MARTKKQLEESVEEVTPQEKPPAQTIEVPFLDVQSQVMGQAKQAAEAYRKAQEEENNLINPELEPTPPLVVWDMSQPKPEPSKVVYGIYDQGQLMFVTDPESSVVDDFVSDNKAELETWVVNLSKEVTSEEDILFMNCSSNSQNYTSYAQYLQQQGLAPSAPKFTSWIEYYRDKYFNLSDEEIAIKVYGNLRYSFSPVKML